MQNKLPKLLDKHKICVICEGNEEYEYLEHLKALKVWDAQYEIISDNAGGNGNIPAIIEDKLKLYYYRGLKKWNQEKGHLTDTCLTAQDKYKAYLDFFRIDY